MKSQIEKVMDIVKSEKGNAPIVLFIVAIAILTLAGSTLYLSKSGKSGVSNLFNNTNSPVTSGNKESPLTQETIPQDQKYGLLLNPNLMPDQWTYDNIVREPLLSTYEKNYIENTYKGLLPQLFFSNNNETADYLNKHFTVQTFQWSSVYESTWLPPERKDLKSLQLVINYNFQDGWVNTNHYRFQDGNTGDISLNLNVFDYQNGKFVRRDSVTPDDLSKFTAFKNGVSNIISEDEAKKLLKENMRSGLFGLNNTEPAYQPYISIDNNTLRLFLEATNFTDLCKNNRNSTNPITVRNCSINLSTKKIICTDKQSACSFPL